MKKRVLQFIGSFHQGGTERQAVSLTRLLLENGEYDVFAATLNNEGALKHELDALDLQIPEFPLTSFYDANFVRQVRQCVKYLRENKIDLVHTHDFYTNIFGTTAARIAGVPVRIASKRETRNVRSATQEFVERRAYGGSDAIIVNCIAVREHLIRQSVNPGKIEIIYNGVDLDSFSKKPRKRDAVCIELGLPHDPDIRFITLVANLRHAVKNVPMLLRVAQRIQENRTDVHFVIAGEGELEAQLREMAENMGLAENVHFIGRCEDTFSLLSISHTCVLTSTAEGFSNSLVEYMAAGKPVVTTNVGGAPEAVIDGETGFLVKSNDDGEMADRLSDLLDDENKASAFGSEGKSVVRRRFSQEKQVQSTLGLYNSLLMQNK